MPTDKKSERRFYQIVGDKIRQQIVNGEFVSEGRLPPERELSETHGVGRTVIRDAIIMLELQGLVEVRQGSGVYVSSRTPKENEQGFELVAPLDAKAGPFEMLQARQLLESSIARFAAVRITDHDIEALKSALALQTESIDVDIKEDADKLFHLAVAKATQNNELVDVVEALWKRRENNPLWRVLHARITVKDYRKRWLIDHEKILQALVRKDPDAAFTAMWSHLENVKTLLLEYTDCVSEDFEAWLVEDQIKVGAR